MTACLVCEKPIEIGQTIVGLPVIRVTASAKSVLAGTELLCHTTCFVSLCKRPKLELVKP